MVKIAQVLPGSIAEELELEIGSRIVRINGELVRDVIDYRFLEADALLEVEVAPPTGDAVIYEIEKDPGEGLGVITAPDTVRQCANKCVFCFVDGNPDGARQTLHLKDDDFRLSFTYGSYVTLTNLGPKGFQRLIDQRLSPLYVSVHATEPAVRERMLGVPLGGGIVQQLRELTAAGLEVHTQIVLCPEWNDGAHLERTINDLWDIGPGVLSLSVVPVGLTQYNLNKPIRLLEVDEAAQALRQIHGARERAMRERGIGWAYAADEMFFAARQPIPDASYYDDWPLTENGVGSVRRFVDDFEDGLAELPKLTGQRVGIVTGTRMAEVIAPFRERIAAQTEAEVDILPVVNTMFGATVTTAGLLSGRDIANAIRRAGDYDIVLIPAESLNDSELFVDDVALATLRELFATTRIEPGHELIETLLRADEVEGNTCVTDFQRLPS
jgi:putative radical SAM enzyme (TIGR03279 family)